jgi:hypothetical protein
MVLRLGKDTVKIYIQVIFHHKKLWCVCWKERGGSRKRTIVVVKHFCSSISVIFSGGSRLEEQSALVVARSACAAYCRERVAVQEGGMSRHKRPASSWRNPSRRYKDIGFALIALRVGPAMKRPDRRVRAVSSRVSSPCSSGGARV